MVPRFVSLGDFEDQKHYLNERSDAFQKIFFLLFIARRLQFQNPKPTETGGKIIRQNAAAAGRSEPIFR